MATKTKKKRQLSKRDMFFYIAMIAWPVLQFCVFYIGVNFKSLTLSFQNIDVFNNVRTWTFDNMRNAFELLTRNSEMRHTELMSLAVYGVSLITGVPLGLLFSYYIFKKRTMSGAFRVLLFVPSIISAIIMVTIYRFYVKETIPEYVIRFLDFLKDKLKFGFEFTKANKDAIKAYFMDSDKKFGMVMFYNIFVSFGTSVLMYSNRMSACDPEMIEASHIDGATGIKEFWYMVLPQAFSTMTTFIVVGIAGIFSNQFNLYSFHGKDAPTALQTFGYYLYVQTANAKSEADYPAISSLGMLLSVVAIVLTFTARKLLNKLDPTED